MVGRRDLITPNPKLRLLDQVKEVLRLKHYSIRTEAAYCDWIRRYVKFHGMRSREELQPAEAKMELFLSDLAANGKVAASTQNQAFSAWLFLYREVLHHQLGRVNALRAARPQFAGCRPSPHRFRVPSEALICFQLRGLTLALTLIPKPPAI